MIAWMQGDDMTETSTCNSFACRSTVEGSVAKCPKCGARMRTPRDVRRLGWFLLLVGLFLTGLMGIVTWNMAPMLLHPGDEVASGSSFTGTAEQAALIFRLFGAVIVFGLAIMVIGGLQIRTGQRSRAATFVTLGLFAVIGVFAYAMKNGFPGS
jgi:hypothetical protein